MGIRVIRLLSLTQDWKPIFICLGQNRKLELVLRHGTDLILVMSGQENPPCCTGGREHYDGGLEMDTDGLETLHSYFCTIPQVQHQCLHTSLAFLSTS